MLGLIKYTLLGCLLCTLTVAVVYALIDALGSGNSLIVGLAALIVAAAKMIDNKNAKKAKNLSL